MKLQSIWKKYHKLPGSHWMFLQALRHAVPYSASIYPTIVEWEPGYAKVMIKERKKIRNHLNSIHAVALMNLAELTSGMATLAGMPETVKGIVTRGRRSNPSSWFSIAVPSQTE